MTTASTSAKHQGQEQEQDRAVGPSTQKSSADARLAHAHWPEDIRHHADQRTLTATFHRHAALVTIYFLWICGFAAFSALWAYTLFCGARSLATLNAEPIPALVPAFLVFVALYESYRYVMFPSGQPVWPALRQYTRCVFQDYPYFRRQATIFEEHEAASLQDRRASLVQPRSKALYAFHPHGILSSGFALNGAHSMRFAQSDARWLVAENLFWFPLLRDMLHWYEFSDVSKETFTRLMREDRVIGFLPGGFQEATLFKRGVHRVYIQKRFGFIKLALQHGYKVHPVYTFGEEQTYHAFSFLLPFRLWLNSLNVPGVFFMGKPQCFYMPLSETDLFTIVGKPLQMPQIEHPSHEEIAKHHKRYVDALVDLFERNKSKYASDPEAVLEVY